MMNFTFIFLAGLFLTGFIIINKKWNAGHLCIGIANAKCPLNIPTYDGGNQGVHPSCLYFPKGWGGHKFWFVFTPYKDMDDAIENPCLYHSDDGVEFTPVQGAYPLDDISYHKDQEYNSDPELVYNPDTNEIECWWRRAQTKFYPQQEYRNCEVLYRSRTKDGIHWTDKEKMFTYRNVDKETHGLISPAIIYEENTYKMWVSNGDNKPSGVRTIDYYEKTEETEFQLKHSCVLNRSIPHHLDVFKDRDRYYLIGFDCTKSSNPYIVYSFANPLDEMHYEGVVLTRGRYGYWDDGRLYRPSVTKVDDQFFLYYSAFERKRGSYCHVGLLKYHSLSQLKRKFLI